MEESTKKKVLISIGIIITVVLIILLVSFIIFYVYDVMQKNAEHSKLRHCVPLIDAATHLETQLNVTYRFLHPPVEYKELADKCAQAIKCVTAHESSVSADVLHSFSSCQFYVFYYGEEFRNCTEKLIAKKDSGIGCLNTLFNDIVEPDVNACHQWDGLQDCVRDQIKTECSQKLMENYEKEETNFRPTVC